ncbi:glycosyltransferase [Candidatus Pelagibacter sp.]|nr:glycosyltransferase [Candidatus Pelagibacter sp.]
MISSLSGGGAENICVSLANSFAKNGWNVDLVILNLYNEAYLNRLSDNVNLVVLNVDHARYSFIPLLKYIYNNKIKIALVFNYELTVILVIMRFLFKFKMKIISRNINTFSIKIKEFRQKNIWTNYLVRPLIKHFYHKTDHVVNQCEAMRDDLISEFPKLQHNSSTIYNPLPMHISDYAKNYDFKKIKKENYLLCVGRLEKQKAFHFAIEAFAGIAKKFPDLRLKIVGKGSLEQDLKQKVIDNCIENRVDFEGFQKNIIPYYLQARGTVLTSLYEGYPNVLIESIAMNTPVVAFDCSSGPNEIIKDGLNGYLVKYQNVDDLKKKLSSLLLNHFDYRDLRISIQKNQIDNIFKKYEYLINSIT